MTTETLDTAQNNTAAGQQAGAETAATTPAAHPPATEGQPAQPQTEAAKTEDAPQGAPEQYADFVLPEGVKLNESVMTEFKVMAKEFNLPQDNAQKLVELGAKMSQSLVESQVAAFEAERNGWKESLKTDKEIGGDKHAEHLATAHKAFEAFGTKELRSLLDEYGLGDHPEIVRWAYRVGKAISEDTLVKGNPPAKPVDPAKKLFPNMA